MLNKLKKYDMFGSPARLNISKRQRNGSTDYVNEYQSAFGLFMTVIAQSICLAYLFYLIIRMYLLVDDDYRSLSINNPFDKNTLFLNMTALHLLPNVAVSGSSAFKNEYFNILKPNADPKGFNLDIDVLKFNRYVETSFII
jgi:hypothetical protein